MEESLEAWQSLASGASVLAKWPKAMHLLAPLVSSFYYRVPPSICLLLQVHHHRDANIGDTQNSLDTPNSAGNGLKLRVGGVFLPRR